MRSLYGVALVYVCGCYNGVELPQDTDTPTDTGSDTGDDTTSTTGSEEDSTTTTTSDDTGMDSESTTDDPTVGTCSAGTCDGVCDAAGECARIVFVSQAIKRGNWDGIAGADATCNAEAGEAGLNGSFAAFLGTLDPPQAPVDHVMLTGGTAPFALPSGLRVADNGEQFTTGEPIALLAAPFMYASGETPSTVDAQEAACGMLSELHPVFTGSTATGAVSDSTCEDWTIGVEGNKTNGIGRSKADNGEWMKICGEEDCDKKGRIYCFQLPL